MGFDPRKRFTVYLALLLLAGGVYMARRAFPEKSPAPSSDPGVESQVSSQKVVQAFYQLEAAESQFDKSVWASELSSQGYEKFFVQLWDNLNKTSNFMQVLDQLEFKKIVLPSSKSNVLALPFGISNFELSGAQQEFTKADFLRTCRQFSEEGIRIAQSEWRHIGFSPLKQGHAPRSIFEFTLHLSNPASEKRWSVHGKLEAIWQTLSEPGAVQAAEINIHDCKISERTGPPLFTKVFDQTIIPENKVIFIDPLMVTDLNEDGFSEIILGCKKLLFWNQPQPAATNGFPREFFSENLGLDGQPEAYTTAVGDLTGDGETDFISADREGLLLYIGRNGRFTNSPVRCWKSTLAIRYAQSLVLGDVNNDGRLDVWLTQYKPPFAFGQMPTPFYDANDGFPSFLLLNQGNGQLTDHTEKSGLAAKAFRRTYSASFVDMNQDGKLDLLVNSDFAGVDFFLNEGGGKFKDVTSSAFKNRSLLGMAHNIEDYNRDGWLDLLAIGMNSPTVDRLRSMGLVRPEFEGYLDKQKEITEGNRLWFWNPVASAKASSTTLFQEQPISDALKRTGWSWGVASFDLENDGDLDIHVVNGHSSYQTVQDYETQFWTHDIYVGNSQHNVIRDLYFKSVSSKTRGAGQSYGGYEKNRLVLQHEGQWMEIGWLAGLALEADCRNLVSEDFDGDGRMDLALTTYEVWPERKQTLKVFKNMVPNSGHWIRFDLQESRESPVLGTQIVLTQGTKITRKVVLNGDSHRSQSPFSAHFGLGRDQSPVEVEVVWPNGARVKMQNPKVDQVHVLRAPQK